MVTDETVSFNVEKEKNEKTREILKEVYKALTEKGYNPINQIVGISVPEARLIVIQPWDLNLLKEIEKEILKADIGINPNNDGKVIRLAFPELNEERRKEIVKEIRKMAEEAKVAIRSIRREAIDDAREEEKNSIITEDDLKLAENNVQKLTIH